MKKKPCCRAIDAADAARPSCSPWVVLATQQPVDPASFCRKPHARRGRGVLDRNWLLRYWLGWFGRVCVVCRCGGGRGVERTTACLSQVSLGKVPLGHWAARGMLRCLDPSVPSLVEGGMDDRREPRRQVLFCTSWSSITSSRNHSAAAVIPVAHIPCNVRTTTVDKSRKSACKFPTPVYY